jgi:hypothetical protein
MGGNRFRAIHGFDSANSVDNVSPMPMSFSAHPHRGKWMRRIVASGIGCRPGSPTSGRIRAGHSDLPWRRFAFPRYRPLSSPRRAKTLPAPRLRGTNDLEME